MPKCEMTLVIHGAPYGEDGEILADVSGFRAAAASAAVHLQPGQYVLAYLTHTGGRTPADPVAKWVCGADGRVSRVNV